MSLKAQIIEKVFAGEVPFRSVVVQTDDATSPNGVVNARKGTLLLMHYSGNAVNNDVYLNTNGSTAWVLVHDET